VSGNQLGDFQNSVLIYFEHEKLEDYKELVFYMDKVDHPLYVYNRIIAN